MRFAILALCLAVLSCSDGEQQTTSKVIDFKTITKGDAVSLEDHAINGTITIFDFYADWCPPCKKVDLSLKDLKGVYGDRIEVLKIDIIGWETPVAKQFGLKDLPYLIIYGTDGKPMKIGDGDMLMQGPSNKILPLLIAELNR